jgi:MFS family permease
MNLGESEIGIITSMFVGGAIVGAMSGGTLSDRLGRKPALILSSILYAVSSMMMFWSPAFFSIVLARFIVGIAGGLSLMVVPVFLAESAPDHYRGMVLSANTISMAFGQLISYVVAFALAEYWRIALGLTIIPAAI